MLRPGPWSPLPPNARLRFDVVRRLLSEVGATGSFLEVGCGQGAAAAVLARHFEYTGFEPDSTSWLVARRRLERIGAGRVVNEPVPDVPDRVFDVLGAFEVLEHLEDDRAGLDAWVGWVRPGGHVLVSVPAHPDRFGPWDVAVGHFRRYTRDALTGVLEAAGLVDVRVTAYGFPLGYALETVRNRIASRDDGVDDADGDDVGMEARTAASGRKLQPGTAAAPFVWLGTLPFLWVQRPFGAGDLGTGFVARGRLPA